LFEASDRIGGRVRTLRPFEKDSPGLIITSESRLSSDFPVELGAERILGTDSIWARFVSQQKTATVALSGEEMDQYMINGMLVHHADALNDSDFLAAKNFFDGLASYAGANISVEEAIQAAGINPAVYNILQGWIGTQYGTSNSNLSIFALADGLKERQRNTLESVLSNNPMTDVLLAAFHKAVNKTELNTIIQAVNYSGEKVTLSGTKSGESFTAEVDKVIITVPVSVLKDGDIAFTPALPSDKQQALLAMDMDPTIRVILDFKKNFWREELSDPDLRFLYGGSEAAEYFNSGAGRSELTKTLSATVAGPKAAELSPLGKDIVPVLLSELDVVFDGLASDNVRIDPNDDTKLISVIQDWGKEPFIKGGNAYLKPGGTNADREALAASVNDKIFFAGEATDVKGEFGTVNGALQSAERAAAEVVAAITT